MFRENKVIQIGKYCKVGMDNVLVVKSASQTDAGFSSLSILTTASHDGSVMDSNTGLRVDTRNATRIVGKGRVLIHNIEINDNEVGKIIVTIRGDVHADEIVIENTDTFRMTCNGFVRDHFKSESFVYHI